MGLGLACARQRRNAHRDRTNRERVWTTNPDKRAEKYFDVAADVRKFEIGLVWQRSLFFWGFIGAAFVAYSDMGGTDHADHNGQIVVACFGFVCSFAWTLLNRGSKYWQEAWETKTERKEREVLLDSLFVEKSGTEPISFGYFVRGAFPCQNCLSL